MANVLVVDDSNELLELFSFLLKANGYEVQTASSKDKLNKQLSLFIPDVILLDVILNDGNGRELCKEIKCTNFNKDIPIILMSASPHLLQDYKDYGADDIIEKPFDNDATIEKINKALVNINTYQSYKHII